MGHTWRKQKSYNSVVTLEWKSEVRIKSGRPRHMWRRTLERKIVTSREEWVGPKPDMQPRTEMNRKEGENDVLGVMIGYLNDSMCLYISTYVYIIYITNFNNKNMCNNQAFSSLFFFFRCSGKKKKSAKSKKQRKRPKD